MNIKRIYSIDTQCRNLLSIFWTATSWCSEDSHINIFQLCYIINNLVWGQFQWFILVTLTTNDTCNLKILCCFKCLNTVNTNVTIAYDGCSNLFHILYL